MIPLILLICVILLTYYLAVKPFSYWTKKNVETGKVTFLFGDSFRLLMGKESYPDMALRLYNKVKGVRFIGTYQFLTPVLVLKSPEIIKQICVRDFDHFLNHRDDIPENVDDLWTKGLVGLKGQPWKDMRSTISPAFSSSKIKTMFTLICRNANIFVDHFRSLDDTTEVEFRDAFKRCANDIVANLAFGIEVNSLKDRNNEFFKMGRDAANFSTPSKKKVFLLNKISPALVDIFQISFFGHEVRSFFLNIVRDAIRMREESNIIRPDMLHLLLEARKGHLYFSKPDDVLADSYAAAKEHLEGKKSVRTLTDIDIAAQLFVFFFGGFDTVTKALCFMTYELAANPDIQHKLIQEIDKNKSKQGMISYESILKMTYLDMVVSETLRKWPPGIETDRVVTKPYNIEPELPYETLVHLEMGLHLTIPIFGIHRDPKYYPDPEIFDPERFSPENRKNIVPYTFLPFGAGPRNCIASRLALLEIKIIFFYLLSHFEIVPGTKTEIPLRLDQSSYSLDTVNGFYFGLKRRT